jgi:hypothetical protein
MARHHRGDLSIDDLPSRRCEATMAERDDVIVCHALGCWRSRGCSPMVPSGGCSGGPQLSLWVLDQPTLRDTTQVLHSPPRGWLAPQTHGVACPNTSAGARIDRASTSQQESRFHTLRCMTRAWHARIAALGGSKGSKTVRLPTWPRQRREPAVRPGRSTPVEFLRMRGLRTLADSMNGSSDLSRASIGPILSHPLVQIPPHT